MSPRLLAMVLMAIALTPLPGGARAAVTETDFQLRTAGGLADLCIAREGDPIATAAANFCEGFFLGVYHTLAEAQGAMPRRLFCMTQPPPTRNQAIADFVSWTNANPSVRSQRPADAILGYLSQRYPCAAR